MPDLLECLHPKHPLAYTSPVYSPKFKYYLADPASEPLIPTRAKVSFSDRFKSALAPISYNLSKTA